MPVAEAHPLGDDTVDANTKIPHDLKYLLPVEFYYHSMVRSCRIFHISSSSRVPFRKPCSECSRLILCDVQTEAALNTTLPFNAGLAFHALGLPPW